MNNKDKFIVFIFMMLIFVLNGGHLAQQVVFTDYYIPLAESILNNFEYGINGKLMTYPMWGYSFFMILGRVFGSFDNVLIIQFILSILAIFSIYKNFGIEFKNWHLLLFIPFISLCSVKWNDAIVASFIVFYISSLYKTTQNNSIKLNIIAGLLFGVILNLRSEYILLLPIQFLIFISVKSVRQSVKLKKHSVIYLTSILTLLPWGIRNYIEFDEFKIGSSNGASVMYISLGQLEDNIWGINPVDETAFKLVKKKGVRDPYSLEGEKILTEEFISKVVENPDEYVKKIINNLAKFVTGGVYTGEYGSLLITDNQRVRLDSKINMSEGLEKFSVITNEDFYIAYPVLFEKIILLIYRMIWLLIILTYIYVLFKGKWDLILVLSLVFLIHKVIIVGGIQYEYRHVNSIYIPIVLALLKYKIFDRNIKSV